MECVVNLKGLEINVKFLETDSIADVKSKALDALEKVSCHFFSKLLIERFK